MVQVDHAVCGYGFVVDNFFSVQNMIYKTLKNIQNVDRDAQPGNLVDQFKVRLIVLILLTPITPIIMR